MHFCQACGHPLGVSGAAMARFCPGCGRPTDPLGTAGDWRTDTAERPRVVPAEAAAARMPPPAAESPLPARFPLYADEYAPADDDPPPDQEAVAPEPATPDDWFSRAAQVTEPQDPGSSSNPDDPPRSPTRGPLLAVVVLFVLAVLVAASWWYLTRIRG